MSAPTSGVRRALAAACSATVIVACACSDGGAGGPAGTPPPAPSATAPAPSGAADARARIGGRLTVDGVPVDADFLGVRVVRDGLVAACQATIPAVAGGAYQVEVVSDAEVRGCGTEGAALLLWVFDGNRYLYSNETLAWPGDGEATTFDATFSASAPDGAAEPVTELKGRLHDAAGAGLPPGTVVEALVGGTLCGVTSLRPPEQSDGYYTLIVASEPAVAGCMAGGTIAFRVGGRPAREAATHDLGGGQEVDLTVP